MGEILDVMKHLLSCMRDLTAKQKYITMPVKDGVIVLIAAAEAMDEVRSAAIQRTRRTAAKERKEEAPVIRDWAEANIHRLNTDRLIEELIPQGAEENNLSGRDPPDLRNPR